MFLCRRHHWCCQQWHLCWGFQLHLCLFFKNFVLKWAQFAFNSHFFFLPFAIKPIQFQFLHISKETKESIELNWNKEKIEKQKNDKENRTCSISTSGFESTTSIYSWELYLQWGLHLFFFEIRFIFSIFPAEIWSDLLIFCFRIIFCEFDLLILIDNHLLLDWKFEKWKCVMFYLFYFQTGFFGSFVGTNIVTRRWGRWWRIQSRQKSRFWFFFFLFYSFSLFFFFLFVFYKCIEQWLIVLRNINWYI